VTSAATLLAAITLPATASVAGDSGPTAVEATFAVPTADTVTSIGCDPVVCHGTAIGAATYSGGWAGVSTYAYRFIYAPSGTLVVDITEQFTGTINACSADTGTFTVVSHETIVASGAAHGEWTIVAGTGGLLGLTGRGTSNASYLPTGVGAGSLAGHVQCTGKASDDLRSHARA